MNLKSRTPLGRTTQTFLLMKTTQDMKKLMTTPVVMIHLIRRQYYGSFARCDNAFKIFFFILAKTPKDPRSHPQIKDIPRLSKILAMQANTGCKMFTKKIAIGNQKKQTIFWSNFYRSSTFSPH